MHVYVSFLFEMLLQNGFACAEGESIVEKFNMRQGKHVYQNDQIL